MILTLKKLTKILPNKNIDLWYNSLVKFLDNYEISSINRVAAFLAQTAHESGNYQRLSENLNYSKEGLRRVFPKYFPDDQIALRYSNRPEKIANRVYANRIGNGPEESGDGWKYRGRGLIQITGKGNYLKISKELNKELNLLLSYIETFDGAVESACVFWKNNNLNYWADNEDLPKMTKIINGGYIGLSDRIEKYNKIKNILISE